MLYSLFRNYMSGNGNLQDILIRTIFTAIIVLIALSVHELSHGYIAYKLGDPTAKNLGRLTLDPRKHLDPIGTVCMLLFGFGWAKPVPVNSRYFKKPRRDMALTALAGPISNLIMAFFGILFYRILYVIAFNLGNVAGFAANIIVFTSLFFQIFHILNLYLAIFNLIPIPPLDGSRILFIFLPDRYYFGLMKYERIISLAVFVLLFTGAFSGVLTTIAGFISNGMSDIIGFIPGL